MRVISVIYREYMRSQNRLMSEVSLFSHRLCLAPMIDWTDKHFRYFIRLLNPNAVLYTEMMTTHAMIHGDRDYLLVFNAEEHPVALQLGGSDPAMLAECARIGVSYGYDEINLNVGCPSERVQSGSFGACLLREPKLVADCVAAMVQAVSVPITIKLRIGVDDQDEYEVLPNVVDQVSRAGCSTFIVHARKAWLKGLSPKQNRDIPPLNYAIVYQLKQDRPDLEIIINGGIRTSTDVQQHWLKVDGVMLGRAACDHPFIFAELSGAGISREEVVRQYIPYMQRQMAEGVRISTLTRPLMGLFNGCPGARSWRRYLAMRL